MVLQLVHIGYAEPTSRPKRKTRVWIIAICSLVSAVTILGVGLLFLMRRKPKTAWRLYKEQKSFELIDESLNNTCDLSEVMRVIHVGLLCVQQAPEDRPTMSTVVLMLTSNITLPEPKEPGFFTERKLYDQESSSSKVDTCSANEITITLLTPR
ncbi:G-type lectin S-receptor-like serine/threonine-protein kinase SD1-1 isoform X4 [Populus alba x Populus x berolinensis]|uniref:G-type lectin S-receptor-like serine/threonine-protein kinase SD1-1 isoform X4 n=1 Tax=Populus alba x Populus x berolinensis TaxID=444605 RepID=A0AAD6RTT3_9ROSI|nr:G-type lectin S-receptor-like serine/threonine-protein kinase SD1-1 isoform X4 [Populus alba x Populus x berolinensis]KAJ7014838.1 G-type lectin S-receptor-like serine/threonine-protein kinase SD1-1 isoform X4 [Populus alba x Populus x berolinensis]